MISYGTFQKSAAWKLYAKAKGIPFEIANAVSDQLKKYEMAVKHAEEDEKDNIDVQDFIEPQYVDIFNDSKEYMGLITSWSIAPCSYLLYAGNIRREIGLVKIKDHVCCLMDGAWAEKKHFLKNDMLKVSVVELIYKSYHAAGMEPPDVNDLLKMAPPEDDCWQMYAKGCVKGLNQVEKTGTSARVGKYAPKNISEMCAFVAAIRPGFRSMFSTFESRKPFNYGVKQFDDLIQTEEMPNSFLLYQEHIMTALNYAGIPMSECYTAIKNIAKKRVEKVLAYKDKFITGFTTAIVKDGKTESEAKMLAEKLWQIIEDSAQYSFNCCLTGDTKIMRLSQGGKDNFSIGEMYHIKTDATYAKSTGHKDLMGKYRYKGYGYALSLCEDGRIHQNKIVDIRPAGVRMTYRITTSDGQTVDCTDNHKFPAPNGEKRCDELHIGDDLYRIGIYEKDKTKYAFTNGIFESNIPVKGQKGFQANPSGDTVVYNQYRKECIAKDKPCTDCELPYSHDVRFEVHHIDFDRTHNEPSNYAWLCCNCHKKRHYAAGRKKRYDKGIPSDLTTIISIEPLCKQETYDVEMTAPNHNFVLDNGLIVSNSHSYCVSLDSLYSAWIKAHYPLAFYQTLLQIAESKGEKDRIVEVKHEAEDYFNISFPTFKFGQDNRSIRADMENNSISNSLTSIKNMPKTMPELLWQIAQTKPMTMIDVLLQCKKLHASMAAVEMLAKIGYFDCFGNIPEVMRIMDLFEFFGEGMAKSVSKQKELAPELLEILKRYSTDKKANGEEASSYTITNQDILAKKAYIAKLKKAYKTAPTDELQAEINQETENMDELLLQYESVMLREMESYILSKGIQDLDYANKIQNQIEILGYVDLYSGKEEDRRKLFIEDVRTMKDKKSGKVWSYRIDTRSIGSGKACSLTVPVESFKEYPIKKNDIIFVPSGALKKNSKGYWYLNWYDKVFA